MLVTYDKWSLPSTTSRRFANQIHEFFIAAINIALGCIDDFAISCCSQ